MVHADPRAAVDDPNECSIVLRVELGERSVILTGDVESGPRAVPSEPAVGADREMLEHAAGLLDVDVLQVGHHGSMTSSRAELLAVVSPSIALVSSAPNRHGSVTLLTPRSCRPSSKPARVLSTVDHDTGAPTTTATCWTIASGGDWPGLLLLSRRSPLLEGALVSR